NGDEVGRRRHSTTEAGRGPVVAYFGRIVATDGRECQHRDRRRLVCSFLPPIPWWCYASGDVASREGEVLSLDSESLMRVRREHFGPQNTTPSGHWQVSRATHCPSTRWNQTAKWEPG